MQQSPFLSTAHFQTLSRIHAHGLVQNVSLLVCLEVFGMVELRAVCDSRRSRLRGWAVSYLLFFCVVVLASCGHTLVT